MAQLAEAASRPGETNPGGVVGTVMQWLDRRPGWLILAVLVVVAACGAGAANLTFNSSYKIYLRADNPGLLEFEDIRDIYASSDTLVFIVAPGSGDVFSRSSLELMRELTDAAWQMPYSTRVDSLVNFPWSEATQDGLEVTELGGPEVELDAAGRELIRERAMSEPLLAGKLVSTRGHVAAVAVTVQLPDNPLFETQEIAAAARALEERLEARYSGTDIQLSGIVMMNNTFGELSLSDASTLIPLMFVVVIVLLAVTLRSLTCVGAIVVLMGLANVVALGIYGWVGWELHSVSALAPIIIVTIAVASSAHVVLNFLCKLEEGYGKRGALFESLKINLQPVFLTALTTTLGFLTMNLSDVPTFHDLGNIVAIGVVASFLLTTTLLPAMLLLLPVAKPRGLDNTVAVFALLGRWSIEKRRILLWGCLAITVLFVGAVPLNRVNDQFVNYFGEETAFRQAAEFADANLTGVYDIELSVAPSAGAVADPEFLASLDEFATWLRDQEHVQHVSVVTDVFRRINQNMNEGDPAYYRLPETRELASQYLLLYELSLPFGQDMNNFMNLDRSATRIVVTCRNLDSMTMLALEEDIRQRAASVHPDWDLRVGGINLLFSHIGPNNVRSMITASLVAMIVIGLILAVVFRSVMMGVVSLIPNLAPMGIAFGIWGLVVGEVGLSLATALGMTLGIVVDDTVHLLSKYQRARDDHGEQIEQAIRYAFSETGLALVVTTAVLMVGFYVLSLSEFSLNSDMGAITALTIFFALLIDFFLLPSLLVALDRRGQAAPGDSTE